jgi:hypothetical protein
MGTGCSTHGVEEECKEDMDVGGIIILKWILEKWDGGCMKKVNEAAP